MGSIVVGSVEWHGTPIVTMQQAAQSLIQTKSGLGYTWIAGFGTHEVLYAADLMEFACHLSRDEAMDLARNILARVDELSPKFQPMDHTPLVVDFYDVDTMEPLAKHMENFEQAKEELARLGVKPA
jgi:hypothetical protein